MPSPTPIITVPTPPPPPPPPPDLRMAQPVVTIKPQGLQSLKTVLKQYSTWALAIILAAPELYQAAATFGMLADEAMPQSLMWAIRGVAGIGLVAKFIKQQKPSA